MIEFFLNAYKDVPLSQIALEFVAFVFGILSVWYAKKENIKSLVLAIDNVAGPQAYNIAKDAEVTVVLYNKRTVKANYAFRKGELNEKAVEAIVKDIPKILEKDEKK